MTPGKPIKTKSLSVKTTLQDDNEDDASEKETKDLSERIADMSLHGWLSNPKQYTESNTSCLERELKDTLPQIENYITTLETFVHYIGRDKPLKNKNRHSMQMNQVFNDKIELGMFIMEKISEIMKLEKTGRNSTFKYYTETNNSVKKYQLELENLVKRFIKILEINQIEHNLDPLAKALADSAGPVAKPKFVESDGAEYSVSYPASTTQTSEQLQDFEGKESPIDFIKQISTKHYLSFSFRDFQKDQEYISICDLEKFSVSGSGRNKHLASMDSASKMVKLILTVQQRGDSISSKRSVKLEKADIESAVKLVCQTENFPMKLKKLCELHTAHLPVYTIITEVPEFTTECKALGYRATGAHKNYSMSKRIAAFKLMEAIPNEEQGKHLLTKGRHVKKKPS